MNKTDECKLNAFMAEVCSYIKWADVHDEVVLELRGHVEDRIEDYVNRGLPYSDALDKALKDMGAPAEIGRGLHRVHRPQTDWLFICMMGVYVGIALITMFSISGGTANAVNLSLYQGMFSRKLLWTGLGLGMMIGATLFDYRRLRAYSVYLWWGIMLLMMYTMIYCHRFGTIGKINLGGVSVDVFGFAPFLLLIAITGMVARLRLHRRNDFLMFTALCAIPMYPFLKNGMPASGLEYSIGLIALLLATPALRKHRGIIVGAVAVVIVCLLAPFTSDISAMRLKAYLHPQLYAHTAAYQYVQGRQALRDAGFWGHGLHASLPLLPGIQDEMVFNYAVYAFGWIGGISIVALALALLVRLVWMTTKTTDVYGTQLVVVVGVMLGIQFIYPVLMAFGVVPMVSVSFPMFGTDGCVTVVEFACLGVIMSIYRRRHIVRVANASQNVRIHVE
ncbi:FtsW/RodA/SpoVE family cell cycle protein [Alicyclobacillus fodiniaquatilis]|uniref:FtsW/RodA/SpoVE family cell cycle protein n=1 Tax=Alicyclobacillus fodiniaquatilis TaxID=1661150 RepID=A0ABW4JQT0_9BACL